MKQLGSNHTFLFMHCACFYSAELTAVTEERTITRSTHQYNSLKSTSYKKLSDSQIHQNKGSQCKNVIKKSETAAIFVVSTLTILQIMIVMIKNRSPSKKKCILISVMAWESLHTVKFRTVCIYHPINQSRISRALH